MVKPIKEYTIFYLICQYICRNYREKRNKIAKTRKVLFLIEHGIDYSVNNKNYDLR